ncbi:MAG TPA: CHAP domain-containing protein [Nitrospira sp.]|nr:CHAP domain-containing protein [Nitrospira sp.]
MTQGRGHEVLKLPVCLVVAPCRDTLTWVYHRMHANLSMSRMVLIGFIVAFATLVGCATSTGDRVHRTGAGPSCCRSVDATSRRAAIVQTASKLVGATTIQVNGKRIAYDCAGVTRAIYLQHGIDLYDSGAPEAKPNGVRLIHHHISRQGKLHQGPLVRPGDLVFFDNTWDYNGDGLVNDPLTHVGIVERQEHDGTVIFISRVAGAIERYRMNLALPHVHRTTDGRVLNDYIRRKDLADPVSTTYLTGQLFAAFGTRNGL